MNSEMLRLAIPKSYAWRTNAMFRAYMALMLEASMFPMKVFQIAATEVGQKNG